MSKHGQELLFWSWGSQVTLQDEDVSQLTSQELRRHLEARELSTVGNKRQLVERLEPQLISSLEGEEIVQVKTGASHVVAVSKEGDLFTWGRGNLGQLGLGDFYHSLKHCFFGRLTPTTVYGVKEGLCVCQVEAGEYHNIVLTTDGEVFAWGHGRDGQLGIGSSWGEEDANDKENKTSFPLPVQLPTLRERVRQIACGNGFSFAVSDSGLWSWGCGDGGVLGHGDTRRRDCPCRVEALSGSYVLQVSAGIWHAAAIVMTPPLVNCGYVYAWGTGLMAQLGLENCQTSSHVPQLMTQLVKNQIYAKSICCGPNHNAIISTRGQLYTWGGNRNDCLGRMLSPGNDSSFTWKAGHVECFGAIVDGIGRGLPRSVACGKDFTVISTYPYNRPTLDEARRMPDGEIN